MEVTIELMICGCAALPGQLSEAGFAGQLVASRMPRPTSRVPITASRARRTRAIPARRPEIIALRVTIAKSGPGDIEAGAGVL